jgi:outer membrane protein OmpA-like peptidoglycan-associated protein
MSVSYTVTAPAPAPTAMPTASPPPAPVAVISVTPARAGLTYLLSALGSHATGAQVTGFAWTVGGQPARSGSQLTYTFATAGRAYPVSLAMTDTAGQTATTIMPNTRPAVTHVTVHFAVNGASLDRSDRRHLMPLRALFAAATGVWIDGYCAARETNSSRILARLSLQRASVVKRFLQAHQSRRVGHVLVSGDGATRFIATNRTANGRAKNRRATVTIDYPKPTS